MNIHCEILQFLLDHIFDINVNIINFLKVEYGKITVASASNILSDMKTEGVILEISGLNLMYVGQPTVTLIENFPSHVEIRITSLGIKRLEQLQLLESSILTNNSVRDTNLPIRDLNKMQIRLFCLTFGVAALGALGQWSPIIIKALSKPQLQQQKTTPQLQRPKQNSQLPLKKYDPQPSKASDSLKKK